VSILSQFRPGTETEPDQYGSTRPTC
jgi:hypothetical protein